jgi:hypothetical protein
MTPEALMERLEGRVHDLGGRGVQLFRNAIAKSKSALLDQYIRPHLLTPTHSYIYLAEDAGRTMRQKFDPGNTVAATVNSDLALPGRWGLFANPLAWVDIDGGGSRPSDRAINVGFCIYTLEFDKLSVAEQLKAIWGGGLKRTDEILRHFKDYRGCEVVYGGNKSLHFHFVFDLRHWNHDLAFAKNSSYQENWLADFPDIYLREAHQDRWEVIACAFCKGTGIEAAPDEQLKYWEQNRRLPLALRRVAEGHPLGRPAGSYVQQVVMASTVRKTVPRQGKGFLHHGNLVGSCAVRHVQRGAARKKFVTDPASIPITNDKRRRFDEFLKQNFSKLTTGTDLRYASVEFGPQGPTLRLYNNAGDENPSSIIQGDYTNVLLQGDHDFEGRTYPLSVSPNQLYQSMIDNDADLMGRNEHVLDRTFDAEVHDCDSYRQFLADHMAEAMSAARLVMILGPEGCGKSHAVMKNLAHIAGQGELAGVSGIFEKIGGETDEFVFISSPSYAQADEKVRDFMIMHPNGPYVPFEYLSITELYQRHCPMGDQISEINALEMGFSSWLRAIHDLQPEIYARMVAHRHELHAIRQRGQIPILFGVHETVRRHSDIGMTRLFYARSFDERWFDQMTPDDRKAYRRKLYYETPFSHVVLDEVSVNDLVSIHRMVDVQWAWKFEEIVENIPEADKLARYKAFKQYRLNNPRPSGACEWSDKSDWTYVQEILHADYSEDDLVQIASERCPFDDTNGIYAECIGHSYYVAPRTWWSGLGRVTILTTELVPAQIIDALGDRCRESDDEGPGAYRVFRFDRPGLFEDFVYIENHRDCKKLTLPRLAEAYGERFPDAMVISDMLKDRLDDDASLITHLSARGSNELAKRDLLAFYTAPSTELFSQLAALDARLGTRNTIALWYVDRFNQTCGRNRGFRGQHGRRHIAVMAHRMYSWLAPYLVYGSRYAFPRQRCSLESELI